MQKGLDYLIQKYSVDAKAVINGVCTANIDGLDYPILSWESERRFIELKNLVKNRLGNMSTYRIGCTDKKSKDIFDLLAREIGILEFTIDSKIIEIFAISGENTLNCIAETEMVAYVQLNLLQPCQITILLLINMRLSPIKALHVIELLILKFHKNQYTCLVIKKLLIPIPMLNYLVILIEK